MGVSNKKLKSCKSPILFISYILMRKIACREVTGLVWHHTASQAQSWAWPWGLLGSNPVPCYLYQTRSFCYNRCLKNISEVGKHPWATVACLQSQSLVEVWLCKKSLKDWDIFTHLGGHFQINRACKPQLKSCDTTLRSMASHHGTQQLCLLTLEQVSLTGRQYSIVQKESRFKVKQPQVWSVLCATSSKVAGFSVFIL